MLVGNLVHDWKRRTTMLLALVGRLSLILGLALLSACSPEARPEMNPDLAAEQTLSTSSLISPTADAITPPTKSASDMARRWTDQGINHYRLAFSITNMNGMGGGDYDGEYTFEVRDGQIIECVVVELGENAALAENVCDFATSPAAFLFSWVERFDPRHTSVKYDPETHLPVWVSYDEPELADEEYLIVLIQFENLEIIP